ncbi:MAG: peptidoglycan-binding protein, partial [Candidatus Kaiserbacteria bacterium]|nr:peptidoglycan-binding protein [Candidatus Kaiserbacteria bacterium]
MKKHILSAFLVLGILFSPAFASPVEASALTAYQITSIISLLQAFGADQSVINNVQTALGGGGGGGGGFCYTFTTDLMVGSTGAAVTALNQALSSSGINTSGNTSTFTEATAADVVAFQARYGISQTGYVGSLTRTKLNQLYGCTGSGGTPTATLTVNGGVTATEVDPLLPRTWAWSSTNGSSYSMSAIISGCETASQNGTVTNWTPWVDGSGTGASGSNTQTPGIVKYGCTIVGTYTATNSAGQPTSASATITFKHASSQANTFTLSVSNTGTGNGTVTSAPAGATFASGTSVTLTATPASGSTFAGWSGACTGTAATCTVSMTANRIVSAMFNSATGGTYSLIITNVGTGSGTIASAPTGTSFASGTSVTLTASPASGSTFAGWSGACTGTAATCTLTMTESK